MKHKVYILTCQCHPLRFDIRGIGFTYPGFTKLFSKCLSQYKELARLLLLRGYIFAPVLGMNCIYSSGSGATYYWHSSRFDQHAEFPIQLLVSFVLKFQVFFYSNHP